MESATREVIRLSMDPRRAMVTAGTTASRSTLPERSGSMKSGRPVGTSPMVGAAVSQNIPIRVPTTRAIRVGGMTFWNREGQSTPMARVTEAMRRALKFTSARASGISPRAAKGPPVTTSWPRKGNT